MTEKAKSRVAQAQAAVIAAEVLAGRMSAVLGAVELNTRLRALLDVREDVPDFRVLMAIDSECDGLPTGLVRQSWAPEARARKDSDVKEVERWAMGVGRKTSRFAMGDGSGDGVLEAALAGDAERLRELLDAGADVDAWDSDGMTPLLSAVFIGDAEAVRLLLAAGAEPNRAQRSDPAATPLWHAREDFGLHEIAALLVKAGATE